MTTTYETLPPAIRAAGYTLHHRFEPGDLGQLVEIHGVGNFRDYAYGIAHEAYCAQIAADFVLGDGGERRRVWLVKHAEHGVVGSVFIIGAPSSTGWAQLRLLYVAGPARGTGLGRWLVEAAVAWCREQRFEGVLLWTADGLERARRVYESLGFTLVETKHNRDWSEGRETAELRFDLAFGTV